jgi:hypothetical protein
VAFEDMDPGLLHCRELAKYETHHRVMLVNKHDRRYNVIDKETVPRLSKTREDISHCTLINVPINVNAKLEPYSFSMCASEEANHVLAAFLSRKNTASEEWTLTIWDPNDKDDNISVVAPILNSITNFHTYFKQTLFLALNINIGRFHVHSGLNINNCVAKYYRREGICYMSQCTALLLLCFARKKMTSGDQAVSMMMSVSDSLVMNGLANTFVLNALKIRDPYHNALRELLVNGWSLKDFGENDQDRLRKSRRILIVSKEPNEKSGNLKKRRLVLAGTKQAIRAV